MSYACGIGGTDTDDLASAAGELDTFSGYIRYARPNWDGDGADPITADTIDAARALLRAMPLNLGEPDMAPGTDGTVGLEWSFSDRPLKKLFIDIGPGNVWQGYWRRTSGEHKTLPVSKIGSDTAHQLAELFKILSA